LTDEKATRERIEALMEQWFPENILANDRFLFYFSGHGETRALPDGRKRGYLVLKSSSKRKWSDMIDMPRMREWSQNLAHARHTLFLLDACFSGLAAFQSASDRGEQTIARLIQPGHHIVTAGIENERSYAFNDASLFTTAFLAAARGDDALSSDGIVSLNQIMIRINEALDQKRAELGDKIKMSPHRWDTRTENNAGEFFFLQQKLVKANAEATSKEPGRTVQSKGDDPRTTSGQALEAYKRGESYLRRDSFHYGKAIEEFTEAIRVDPNFAAAYTQRGKAYLLKRDHDYIMIELDLPGPFTEVDRARKEFMGPNGEYHSATDKALSDLEMAVQLDPNSGTAHVNRGEFYFERGELDRALDDYSHAIRVDPTLAIAYADLGRVYIERRDFDRAIESFNKAIILDPKLAMAMTYRGEAFREKDNLSTAVSNYLGALEIDQNQYVAARGIETIFSIYRSRGEAYLKEGKFDDAVDAFTWIIQRKRKDVSAFLRRGEAYQRKRDFDRAVYDYSQAIQLEPSRAPSYTSRGEAYRAWGRLSLATADYKVALALSPNDTIASNGLRQLNPKGRRGQSAIPPQ
jgi:tetratricopeptide (TPR) repeat protein